MLAMINYAHATQWYISSQLTFKQLRLAEKAIAVWFKSGKQWFVTVYMVCEAQKPLLDRAGAEISRVAMYCPLLFMDGRVNLAISTDTHTIYTLSEYPWNLTSLVHSWMSIHTHFLSVSKPTTHHSVSITGALLVLYIPIVGLTTALWILDHMIPWWFLPRPCVALSTYD